MDGYKCIRCGQWWASQAGNAKRFDFITRFCPNCIVLTFPTTVEMCFPRRSSIGQPRSEQDPRRATR